NSFSTPRGRAGRGRAALCAVTVRLPLAPWRRREEVRRGGYAMISAVLALTLTLAAQNAAAPKEELLWPKGAPGAIGTEARDKPPLTVFPPPPGKANGTAVVVCPGGGYSGLAINHEGEDVAAWFNARGVTAFMLKYRLAPYRHPAPLQDAQRALRTVRAR